MVHEHCTLYVFNYVDTLQIVHVTYVRMYNPHLPLALQFFDIGSVGQNGEKHHTTAMYIYWGRKASHGNDHPSWENTTAMNCSTRQLNYLSIRLCGKRRQLEGSTL